MKLKNSVFAFSLIISQLIGTYSFAERALPLKRMSFSRSEKEVGAFYQMPLFLGEDYNDGHASLDKIRHDLAILKTLGVSYLRFGFSWLAMEPSEGHYEWSGWDQIVDEARDAHIQLIPYVSYTPQWAREDQADAGKPPRDLAAFGKFMAVLVDHYKQRDPGVIPSWELWNEPDVDSWKGTAAQFAQMVKAAAVDVRQVDPDAVIIIGGLTEGPSGFYEGILANGVGDYADVFAYHVYPETWWAERNEDILPLWPNVMTKELRAAHSGADLWLNEFGYADYRFANAKASMWSEHKDVFYNYEHTAAYQAVDFFKIQMLTLASQNVSMSVWYRINDFKTAADVNNDGDPVNLHLGILDDQGQPKPVYHAIQAYQNLFSTPVRCIDAKVKVFKPKPSQSIVHVFEKENGDLVVSGWLRSTTVKEGQAFAERSDIGLLGDQRREVLRLQLPPKMKGSLQLFNDQGQKIQMPSLKLSASGLLSGIELTGDQIFLLTITHPK